MIALGEAPEGREESKDLLAQLESFDVLSKNFAEAMCFCKLGGESVVRPSVSSSRVIPFCWHPLCFL